MKKIILFVVLTILILVSFSDAIEGFVTRVERSEGEFDLSSKEKQADQKVMLPPAGSMFMYGVKVSGDIEATKEAPNEHYEYYEFKGLKKGVKGQTKDGTVESSLPYDSAWWRISRSDNRDRIDLYSAVIRNALCWYLEANSNGDITWYTTPIKGFEFPLESGKTHSGNGKTYLWVHDTGSWIVSTYETKGSYPDYDDSTTINVTVSKGRVEVPAGVFDCYKVRAIFTVKSGSGITASTTVNDQTNWFSPELKTWVREHSELDVSAAFRQKFHGTRIRELENYRIT